MPYPDGYNHSANFYEAEDDFSGTSYVYNENEDPILELEFSKRGNLITIWDLTSQYKTMLSLRDFTEETKDKWTKDYLNSL
jgi:hypothetical protein